MAHMTPIERLIVHTICGVRMEFYRPTVEVENATGMLAIFAEATPDKRFYFTQIDYIEAIH
jgi:hypothetical protein